MHDFNRPLKWFIFVVWFHMFSRTGCPWLFIALYLNLMVTLPPPSWKHVLLWPLCVFVFSLWQGSSTDIICSCIIIQATASPQGSPAETKPLSSYLSPSAWHFLSCSRLLCMAECDTSDGWVWTQPQTGCMAQDLFFAVSGFVFALWSHQLVPLERTLSHSERGLLQWKKKFSRVKKWKDLIKRSAKPSGLYKCVLHPCGNTSSL